MLNPIITIDAKYQMSDIKKIIECGVKSFRINPARIGCENAYRVYMDICKLAQKPSIFIDTAGNKSRVFIPEKKRVLNKKVTISKNKCRVADLYIDSDLFQKLEKGDSLIIRGDESYEITIDKAQPDMLLGICKESGYQVKKNAHTYIKDKYIENTNLSEKDLEILNYFHSEEAAIMALSFADCENMILLAREKSPYKKIYAKIETPQAYANIDRIIDVADGIIIGRDDLSVFYSENEINTLTLEIARKCKTNNKTCIPASNFFIDLLNKKTLPDKKIEYLRLLMHEGVTNIYCNETVINRSTELLMRILNNCNMITR